MRYRSQNSVTRSPSWKSNQINSNRIQPNPRQQTNANQMISLTRYHSMSGSGSARMGQIRRITSAKRPVKRVCTGDVPSGGPVQSLINWNFSFSPLSLSFSNYFNDIDVPLGRSARDSCGRRRRRRIKRDVTHCGRNMLIWSSQPMDHLKRNWDTSNHLARFSAANRRRLLAEEEPDASDEFLRVAWN